MIAPLCRQLKLPLVVTFHGFDISSAPLRWPAYRKKLQTLFTKNKETARSVLETLQGGQTLVGRQAGRELSTQIPRTTSSIGSLLQGAAQTVLNPKWIGEFTAFAGNVGIKAEKAKSLASTLQKLQPLERVAILNALFRNE